MNVDRREKKKKKKKKDVEWYLKTKKNLQIYTKK